MPASQSLRLAHLRRRSLLLGSLAAAAAIVTPARARADIRLLQPLVYQWKILAGRSFRVQWTYARSSTERTGRQERHVVETRVIESRWSPIQLGRRRKIVALSTNGDVRVALERVTWEREDYRGVARFSWVSTGATARAVAPTASRHQHALDQLTDDIEEATAGQYRARLRSFGDSAMVRDDSGLNLFYPAHLHLPLRPEGYVGGERHTAQLADFGPHHDLFEHPAGGERAFELDGVARIKTGHKLVRTTRATLRWRTSREEIQAQLEANSRFLREGQLDRNELDWVRVHEGPGRRRFRREEVSSALTLIPA